MKRKSHPRARRSTTKSILRLPDLEQAKVAVLNSLTSPDAQRGYRHAIYEFVDWYCSEPRLAFNRTVVLRYRSHFRPKPMGFASVDVRSIGGVARNQTHRSSRLCPSRRHSACRLRFAARAPFEN